MPSINFQMNLIYTIILALTVKHCICQYLTSRPNVFITSNDTEPDFDAYQLIYDGSRFFQLSEYVLFGIDAVSEYYILYVDYKDLVDMSYVLTIDDVRKATVTQNLMKELYFAHFNASGVFPQMIISNATTTEILTFRAREPEQPEIKNLPILAYVVDYPKEFDSLEMVPPFDLLVEVPGYSHTMTARKSLINVQSFAFLRFQMTDDDLTMYPQILYRTESLAPTYLQNNKTWSMLESSMKIIHNPCIQDFFLLYMVVGRNDNWTEAEGAGPVFTYLQVPAYFTEGNDGCWMNITSIYCPNFDYQEECGQPEDLVLTNRNLLILTSKGLFVSNDLTESNFKLSDRVTSAPLARYDIVDPCADIAECFQQVKFVFPTMANPTEENLIFKRSLRYTPFCDAQQYPNNDDMVIFILEHTDKTTYRNQRKDFNGTGPVKTYTVTYAARPYRKWLPLFIKQEFFEDRYIQEITGIYFNNHFFRFDITMKLSPPVNPTNRDDPQGKYVRFVLPLPAEEPYTSSGYPNLNGTWGQSQGFIVQNFSESFQINGVAVNPGTMDLMFYGSEIHIAESSRPIVYQAVGGFVDASNSVTGCHFNHPDRFYVCMLSKKTSVLIGRVATFYGPVEVDLKELTQIQRLIDVIFAVDKRIKRTYRFHEYTKTQEEVLEYIFERAMFTASFTGQIYMWYFSDPHYFLTKIPQHDEECQANPKKCPFYNSTNPLKRPAGLPEIPEGLGCGSLTCYVLPCILPLPLDPLEFKVRNTPTNGPLVPFFVDADTLLLYEGFVPGIPSHMVRYLTPVFTGQKIYCSGPADDPNNYSCELYFRHIKMLVEDAQGSSEESLLPGFRSTIYATIVKPVPMAVVQDNLKIQMPENTNRVRIVCTNEKFEDVVECKDITSESVGGSLYIPGEFSVLILGADWQVANTYKGIATHKTVLPMEVKVPANQAFKMSLRTEIFVSAVMKYEDDLPHLDSNGTFGCNNNPPKACQSEKPKGSETNSTVPNDWEIGDGGCHFELSLTPNSYIKSSGGKIDLDLQDSVSFKVVLQPLTGLGRIMLYRPLLALTQSNPEVLHISSKFVKKQDRQILSIMLKPTGVKQGVSSFVIRSQVSSISCSSPSSLTFIVQCVRTRGRRLIVEYPQQVDEEEILKEGTPVMLNQNELYKVLETNYRPPSLKGSSIPLTDNVYNVDPSKPLYKGTYQWSRERAEFKQCFSQANRLDCGCTNAHKLSDDPAYSDCKEKVYVVKRSEVVPMSLSYPPRLPDEEQLQEFFSPTPQISVSIQEINGRVDYSIVTDASDRKFLDSINRDEVLNMGDVYYSGKNLKIELHGTGLYHFKAQLGRFHSFNEVTGYFILYSDTNELDDVLLVMIVILVMTICFVLVFFGFLRVRHRLVAHLPIRVEPMKGKVA